MKAMFLLVGLCSSMVSGSHQGRAVGKSGKVYLIEMKDRKIFAKEIGIDYADYPLHSDFMEKMQKVKTKSFHKQKQKQKKSAKHKVSLQRMMDELRRVKLNRARSSNMKKKIITHKIFHEYI